MSDIVEFLRARLNEDEQAARAALAPEKMYTDDGGFTVEYQWARLTLHDSGGRGIGHEPGAPSPARVLREVEAKRRILDLAGEISRSGAEFAEQDYRTLTRSLAAVYSDHPDYQADWAP